MIAVVAKVLNPVIIIFLISTMLACGLGLTVRQIFAPFRNVRLAISAALLNFVVVPFIAIAASRLVGLRGIPAIRVGSACDDRCSRGEPEVHHQRQGGRGSFCRAPAPCLWLLRYSTSPPCFPCFCPTLTLTGGLAGQTLPDACPAHYPGAVCEGPLGCIGRPAGSLYAQDIICLHDVIGHLAGHPVL